MLLGATPEFFGEVPTWEIAADYTQKKLIGWSYENDGTVDELLPISEADVTAGTIKLYPVYKNVVYSFAVISKDATEYYVEEDFGALLTSAPSGATIKLVRDVYTEVATVQLKKPLTIDLNGHNLKRCFVYGNVYEATKNGDEFVYDATTVANTVASGGDIFFQYYANYASLTITSSTGSGTFYNFKMDADTWTYNGETVKRVSKAVAPARLTNASESTKSTSYISLTLNGGITVYASQLFYSLYASGTGYSITVDNVKYYKLDSTAFITSRTNYTININITNSLIYAPNNGGDFVFLGTTNNSTYGSEHYSKIVIKNCDVIKSGTGWGFNFSNTRYAGTTDVIFDNCRLYDAGVESATTCDPDVVGINGTLCYYTNLEKQESIPVNHPEGWSEEKVSIPVTYYVPSTTFAVTGDDINVPTFDYPATEKQTKNYNRLITKEVDVNWVDANGKVIKTDKLTPGIDAIPTAPVVTYALESDPYRNILAQWVDENGNALASKLGVTTSGVNWQNSYTFRPVKPTENIQYVGGLKDIFFNLSFNSKFCYNLYLPAGDANLTVNDVSGFTKGSKVKIDGNAYYVYTFTPGTTAAADTTDTVIKFTANGVNYEQTLRLDALLYADIILASSDVEEEKLAVGNMARFIMEACQYSGIEVDEERFNAIISAAGVNDYAESYVGEGNIEVLKDYISTVSYVIYNGASAYKFVLTDAAYAENIKFTLNDKNIDFTVNGAEIILNSARVYDIIDTLTITVEGKSATYSMLDNIEANPNSDLLKALYEFGLAAENYRAYIETIAE